MNKTQFVVILDYILFSFETRAINIVTCALVYIVVSFYLSKILCIFSFKHHSLYYLTLFFKIITSLQLRLCNMRKYMNIRTLYNTNICFYLKHSIVLHFIILLVYITIYKYMILLLLMVVLLNNTRPVYGTIFYILTIARVIKLIFYLFLITISN